MPSCTYCKKGTLTPILHSVSATSKHLPPPQEQLHFSYPMVGCSICGPLLNQWWWIHLNSSESKINSYHHHDSRHNLLGHSCLIYGGPGACGFFAFPIARRHQHSPNLCKIAEVPLPSAHSSTFPHIFQKFSLPYLLTYKIKLQPNSLSLLTS